MGRKVFTAGSILRASEVNTYLMDQTVQTFAGTAERGTAIGTATDGMISYLQDTNSLEVYKTSGTSIAGWESVGVQSPNLLVNGGMDIWQRGTAFASTGWTADRWNAATGAWGRSTAVPSNVGAAYSLSSTSSQTNWIIATSVEMPVVGSLSGFSSGAYTFSFYAKVDSGKTITAGIWWADGYGGGNQSAGWTSTFTGTGSWARHTLTFTPTGQTPGATNKVLRLAVYNLDSVAFTSVGITGLQLEVGATATPFKRMHPNPGSELRECKRYYQAESNALYSTASNAGFTNSYANTLSYEVEMRGTPTVTIYPNSSFGSSGGSATWYPGNVSKSVTQEFTGTTHTNFMTPTDSTYNLCVYTFKAEAEI